jgi:GT2 family glycosyltransferase
MSSEPKISVIVPTYNRAASLKRTLDALCLQSYSFRDFEVIVVSDGCTDETPDTVRGYDAPFTLHLLEQQNGGAAAARNRGAQHARSQVLLFIDDDVEPAPELITAHARAHEGKRDQAVIGPYPAASTFDSDFAGLERRAWWDKTFDAMSAPGHRFTFTDLVSGNFSINKELFERVGGFNADFRCHEDSELGTRLIKSGADFNFAVEALACHHEESTVSRSFERKRQEGKFDVCLVRLHPELLPALPIGYYSGAPCKISRILRALAFVSPQVGDGIAKSLQIGLHLLEDACLRDAWKGLWDVLKDYWYWRGAAGEIADRRVLADLAALSEGYADEHPEVEIDLSEGLDAAERLLDEQRPAVLRLIYGSHPIGVVPFAPGAELLKGAHLRSILTSALAAPMIAALTKAGVTTESDSNVRDKLAFIVQFKSCWFGRMETRKHWSEQYAQWSALDGRNPEDGSLFWRQQTEITSLKNEKLVLDRQYAHWQRVAQRCEEDVEQQRRMIDNLEREKKSLEQQWERLRSALP